jgi:hypothetical protein
MQGWGRTRRNRGGEGRQRGDILTFTDEITDIIFSYMIPMAILPVKWTRHCMKIPV